MKQYKRKRKTGFAENTQVELSLCIIFANIIHDSDMGRVLSSPKEWCWNIEYRGLRWESKD